MLFQAGRLAFTKAVHEGERNINMFCYALCGGNEVKKGRAFINSSWRRTSWTTFVHFFDNYFPLPCEGDKETVLRLWADELTQHSMLACRWYSLWKSSCMHECLGLTRYSWVNSRTDLLQSITYYIIWSNWFCSIWLNKQRNYRLRIEWIYLFFSDFVSQKNGNKITQWEKNYFRYGVLKA